jgi:hypothetical protein
MQILLTSFTVKGILKKYSSVWLDRARPADTSVPPSFLQNAPVWLCGIPAPKNMFASFKN